MFAIFPIFLYLIRILMVGMAVGVLYIKLNLFREFRNHHMLLIGMASTPFFVSLTDFLLGLVFVGWPSWFYYAVPMTVSCLFLLWKNNYLIVITSVTQSFRDAIRIVRLAGKWIYLDLAISAVVIFIFTYLFYIPGIREEHLAFSVKLSVSILILTLSALLFIRKMNNDGTLKINCFIILLSIISVSTVLDGISFNDKPVYDADQAHYQLDARYFATDRNSWEVDDYTDEKYGSSMKDDHGPLWIMFLADAELQAHMLGMGNSVRVCNFAIFWTLSCFYVLLFLTTSYLSDSYFAGVISLYLFLLYRYTILMILGSRDAFRMIGLLLLLLYILNVIPVIIKDQAKWYHYMFMFIICYLCMNGHESNAYIMLCMAVVMGTILVIHKTKLKSLILCGLSVFCGTLLGITKTISIYIETGMIQSTTRLPTARGVATNADRLQSEAIWSTYSDPVIFMMILGMIGLVVMIVFAFIDHNQKLLVSGLLIFGMLLPLTGILDWIGYAVSKWFVEQLRYRLYFLMIFAMTGSWLLNYNWKWKYVRMTANMLMVFIFLLYIYAEYDRLSLYNTSYVSSCKVYASKYRELADRVSSLTDGGAFTDDQILLYYLHGNPKLLFHSYSDKLIRANTDEEIEHVMDDLNIGAILLPDNGMDTHDYSTFPFWEYINKDNSFNQVPDERTKYVIFYRSI